MSASATISSKFQISIPKAVREALHLKAGQELVFVPKNGSIVLVPVRKLEEMTGMLKDMNLDTENYRDRNDRY
ncbi:MAG: AbrB/MazE/SpoVT family DNA-binding domain-containing protein [Rudaea sp.]|uniref:AbrB/MazE/SpoVT family DNA-binding domain-containing protein n=1 Tax=Rudaea sp. TaxID=2136325 RepID=UPI0039E6EDF8